MDSSMSASSCFFRTGVWFGVSASGESGPTSQGVPSALSAAGGAAASSRAGVSASLASSAPGLCGVASSSSSSLSSAAAMDPHFFVFDAESGVAGESMDRPGASPSAVRTDASSSSSAGGGGAGASSGFASSGGGGASSSASGFASGSGAFSFFDDESLDQRLRFGGFVFGGVSSFSRAFTGVSVAASTSDGVKPADSRPSSPASSGGGGAAAASPSPAGAGGVSSAGVAAAFFFDDGFFDDFGVLAFFGVFAAAFSSASAASRSPTSSSNSRRTLLNASNLSSPRFALAWMPSDDDDVWHPDRATAYRAAADAARADASCVVCPRLARPAGGAAAPADAAAVAAAVAAGRAATTDAYDEYFSYCCRRRVLDAFFAVATEDLRRCQYCDVAWYRYLSSREASRAFAPRDARNWLYFYDKAASGASARVEVREQHRAVARRVADADPEGAPPAAVVARVLAARDNAAELYCACHVGAPTALAGAPFLDDGEAFVGAQLASLGVLPRALLDWLRPTHRDALFFAASNFGVAFEAEATARGDDALE